MALRILIAKHRHSLHVLIVKPGVLDRSRDDPDVAWSRCRSQPVTFRRRQLKTQNDSCSLATESPLNRSLPTLYRIELRRAAAVAQRES